MAITLTNLTPVKNDTDVPVASDISLTLQSDGANLDVGTIRFFINGIEVQASAYYGVDQTEINVGFFAKRKIKYKTRRYGQDDVRYGQRDIFPSSFQYGQRYICSIRVEDITGLAFEENFSFVIEEGIFYNSNPMQYFYHPQTQSAANYAPEWAKARYDKYSNFQQLVNAPGAFLQEIEDSLYKQAASYFVQTSNLNDLSTLYKVELGGDFEFETIVLDDGATLQIPPALTATKEITKFNPDAEYQNDIKSFFFDKLPTRLDEEKTSITDLVLLPKTEATDTILEVDKKLERDGYLCIVIEDGLKFTKSRNNILSFTFCRIKGESRERKEQTEDLVIIDNDSYFTSKLWRRIDSIQFIDLPDDSNIHFSIDHSRPLRSFIPDSFSHISIADDDKTSFWKAEDTTYGTVLQQWTLLEVDPEDLISSLGQKDLVTEFELLDTDGVTNLSLLDLESDPFNNFIYGINDEYLYLFDKREDYSESVKLLSESNGTAAFVLDIDSDELGRGDSVKTIGIIGLQKNVGRRMAQYRISVIRPDGITEYLLADGTTTTDKALGATVADITQTKIKTNTIFYDLDILGDYVFQAETIYRDGSTEKDAKIVRLHKKAALSKYKLERIFGDATISRMFLDFDQRLKVLDSNNELHTIRFAKDNMLIDYSDSAVFFNEDYDEVNV